MSATSDLLVAFELHSPDRIRAALQKGASPVELITGKTPLLSLIEMYSRSPRFADCLRVMLEAGATFDDPVLQSILLEDSSTLSKVISAAPELINRRTYLSCTFTSMNGVTPLHVCAEYNSVACARVLLAAGASVNARAEVDADGIGGHTALFHTVNSNANFARPSMELLLDAGADLDILLKGVIWGGGFEWETTVFEVTPISYAQCGLYSQFHRNESEIYSNIALLYQRKYGASPQIRNVPNQYLRKS